MARWIKAQRYPISKQINIREGRERAKLVVARPISVYLDNIEPRVSHKGLQVGLFVHHPNPLGYTLSWVFFRSPKTQMALFARQCDPRATSIALKPSQFWLFMSTSYAYYGQAVWLKCCQPESMRTTFDRYIQEFWRVSEFLDRAEIGWLEVSKLSYANLAVVIWRNTIKDMLSDEGFGENKFPSVSVCWAMIDLWPTAKDPIVKQDKTRAEKLKAVTAILKSITPTYNLKSSR